MNGEIDRWAHLNIYERRYLREVMQDYDDIMKDSQDIEIIAAKYQLSSREIERAKNYAFGSGVSQYQFSPDPNMVKAWRRMAGDRGNEIDEVFLRHEIYESDLVINGGLTQAIAHQQANTRYPWADLVQEAKKS